MEEIKPREYYSVKELAEHWKVQPRTIQREVRRGEITTLKVGRQFRFTGESILEYKLRNRIRSKF